MTDRPIVLPVMIRITLLIWITGSICSSCFAQNLSGKIVDSASRKPVPYATVLVMKIDRRPVTSVLSDSTGSYTIRIDSGSYFLLYTCAGYRPFQSAEIHSTASGLPLVSLSRDTTQLATVTVVGRRPAIEPAADGFVYNPENDIAIAAGSAADVLRRIPMVTVLPEGGLQVRGSTNVRVFIDNRPSSVYANTVAEALRQVPSEEIAKVEVITHPSSKYDAEGTDAVINIITKKNRYNGFNGMVRTDMGEWTKQLNSTFKMRSGYWIANIDAGIYLNNSESGQVIFRSTGKTETANRFLQFRESNWAENTSIFALNTIRIIDSLNSLNFGYRYRTSTGPDNQVQRTQSYAADTIETEFTRNIPGFGNNDVHSATAGYSGQSRNKKQELTFMATYFRHRGSDGYNLEQKRLETIDFRENRKGHTSNDEVSVQVDLLRNLTPRIKLETGIKGIWRNSASENLIDVYDPVPEKFIRNETRSNFFQYNRGVYAAYANYSMSRKNWQWRAGVRFEHTSLYTHFKDTALQIPAFNNLLPSFLIKRTLNEKNALTASFTSRLVRPYFAYLNPNINYVDSMNITYGNPGLQPEIIHNYVLEYNYNNRAFFGSLSLIYTNSRNNMDAFRVLRPDKIVETTYRNIGRSETWGLSTSARYSGSRFTAGTTVLLRYLSLSSPSLGLSNTGLITQLDLNTTYRFNKGFAAEFLIYYISGYVNIQQTRDDYFYYNLMLSKKFMNDKITVSLRAGAFMDRWFYQDTEINTPTLYQLTTSRNYFRQLRIAASWKFGKQDIRTPVSRHVDKRLMFIDSPTSLNLPYSDCRRWGNVPVLRRYLPGLLLST